MLSVLPDDAKTLRDWTPRVYDALEVVALATKHIAARKNVGREDGTTLAYITYRPTLR